MNINKNLLFQSPPNEDYAKNGIDDLMSGRFYGFYRKYIFAFLVYSIC